MLPYRRGADDWGQYVDPDNIRAAPAMTANAFKEDVENAKAAGMQAHIAKPIDVNLLMAALRSVLK